MAKCLCCYQDLHDGEVDFHTSCARRFFGTKEPPRLDYTHAELKDLAKQFIRTQTTVTGVQAKLSLDIERVQRQSRFTIVGLWGKYILKPQTEQYPFLPELEDVTMHLAELAHIRVVPHTLVRFADGRLCYLTKRIDRTDKGEKIPMEDTCQLLERLTEYKYRGSYEQIAKVIARYSSVPMLDVVNFWEIVLFSWLTGNSDMHLKNFSLFAPDDVHYQLTPAYDLVNTLLVLPSDTEELALNLNGKKNRILREDFEVAMSNSGLDAKVIANIFAKFKKVLPLWEERLHQSFLPAEMQDKYIAGIRERFSKL